MNVSTRRSNRSLCHSIGACLGNFFQLFSDGNELCSHFSRYISPAYHHDKCERYVQMRLYSTNKAEFAFVYFVFAILLLLATIIGSSGPPIESVRQHNVSDLTNLEHELPVRVVSPALEPYHKQLWLFVTFYTKNADDETYAENIQIGVSVLGVNGRYENNRDCSISNVSAANLYHGKNFMNRSRNVKCQKNVCEAVFIAHLSYVEYTCYEFAVKFHNIKNFHRKYAINIITFTFKSYSPEYTRMELSFRTLYSITSMMAMLWFGNSLRKYAVNDWSYEQKWMMILLLLLFLYDGPLYSATVLFDNWFFGFMDAVFQITFLSAIAMFNICVYHALRQNERRFASFYLEKVFIVGVLWFLSLALAYQTTYEHTDFTYNLLFDWGAYQVLVKWWFIFLAIYFVYLIVSMVKAYNDLRTLSFFDKRLKFASSNVAIFSFTVYCCWKFDYGICGFLQDTYVASITDSTIHPTSTSFMALYGALNMYLCVMAYVYSASQKSIFENVVMKDNPTMSMMDNSEDEGLLSMSVKMDSATTKLLLNTSDEEDDFNKVLFNKKTNSVNIKSHNDDSD